MSGVVRTFEAVRLPETYWFDVPAKIGKEQKSAYD